MWFSILPSISLSFLLTPVLSSPIFLALVHRATETLPSYNSLTIFQAPATYIVPSVLYTRRIQLSDGSILATCENYSLEPPGLLPHIQKRRLLADLDRNQQSNRLSPQHRPMVSTHTVCPS
ncbi:hypothetical protein EV426DRAFT_33095 [Tirmania nivea]|nr:hypothetical protein EV426DRAFT_33095 [Tirmania nivea]